MRYLSLCSGIEGASVAWMPLGWTPVAFAENEPFACAVLAQRFPSVPNLGDIAKYEEWPDLGTIDLVVAGTPCQGFSIAGLRGGLADDRSNLMLTALRILQRYQPRWFVWENVPGVFSSYTDVSRSEDDLGIGWDAEQAHDFGSLLQGLSELGYSACWRVLDAQYARVHGYPFAVPQRRRRVFVVGYLGDWRRPAAVLLEPESLHRNPPTRRTAGQAVAPALSARTTAGGGHGTDFDVDGGLIPEVANPLTHRMFKGVNTTMDEGQTMVAHSLRADGFDASEDGTGRGIPLVADPVTANEGKTYTHEGANNFRLRNVVASPIAFDTTQITHPANYSQPKPGDACHPLASTAHPPAIAIQERAVSENYDTIADGRARVGPDGKGWRDDGASYTVEARHTPQAVAFQPRFARNGRGAPDDIASALTAEAGTTGKGDSAQVVAYGLRSDAGREGKALTPSADAEGYVRLRDPGFNVYEEHSPTLDSTQPHSVVDLRNGALGDVAMSLQAGGIGDERGMSINSLPHVIDYAVRRLTPLECERLQGFPDGWTNIIYRGKPAKDGPRYKALGNAFAVPCPRWIGYRIQAVEDLGLRAEGGVFG